MVIQAENFEKFSFKKKKTPERSEGVYEETVGFVEEMQCGLSFQDRYRMQDNSNVAPPPLFPLTKILFF